MNKISKSIIAGILAASAALSLTACGNNTPASSTAESSAQGEQQTNAKSPAEITEKIMQDIEFPSMAEITSDRLANYYEIDAQTVDSFSAYICGSGAYPDEIAVFKLKSSGDAEAAKAALEKRVESQTKTFENYTPNEMYKIDGKNIVTNGSYIALIISADNKTATQLFEQMTK